MSIIVTDVQMHLAVMDELNTLPQALGIPVQSRDSNTGQSPLCGTYIGGRPATGKTVRW
jgi:hypothetical protein